MRCDAMRYDTIHIFIRSFIRLLQYLYMSNKVRTNSDIIFEFKFPPKLEFCAVAGGAGARTALLVGGVAEAAPPIPALYSGVLNRFKRDGRERVARAG